MAGTSPAKGILSCIKRAANDQFRSAGQPWAESRRSAQKVKNRRFKIGSSWLQCAGSTARGARSIGPITRRKTTSQRPLGLSRRFVRSHSTRERKTSQRFVSRNAFKTEDTNQRLRQSRTSVPISNQWMITQALKFGSCKFAPDARSRPHRNKVTYRVIIEKRWRLHGKVRRQAVAAGLSSPSWLPPRLSPPVVAP